MSKAILEIDLPDNCLKCPLGDYESGDDEESLFCIPLTSFSKYIVEGDYQKRRADCPLKMLDDDEMAKRASLYPELVGMLKRLEYTKDGGKVGSVFYKFCPICGIPSNAATHYKDCQLEALLKRV